MSSTERLFFPPTGEETSHYVLVDVSLGADGKLQARSTLQEPGSIAKGAEHPPAFPARDGDLASVLSEACKFAETRGYPVRVRLGEGAEFPAELGTFAERQIGE